MSLSKLWMLVGVVISVMLPATVLISIGFGNAAASRGYPVSTSQGILLSQVTSAFNSEDLRKELSIGDINVFIKSGGAAGGGQQQQVLRTNLPINVIAKYHDVSFQYFVDVRNDLTGSNSFHCSDIRLHVFLDSREMYVTDWMGFEDRNPPLPIMTPKITIHTVHGGVNEIVLVPGARQGGCNPGYIQSWGGTVVLFG